MADLIKIGPSSVPAAYEPPAQNIWVDQYLDENQSEITRYLRILVRRRWLICGLVLVSAVISGYITFTTKPLYKSTAKIQIDPEASILPYQPIYSTLTENPLYLGTQTQVLKSQMLALRIVKRLNLVKDPAKAINMARFFTSNLEVAPVQGTQVVSITYTADDSEFAAQAVNALADEYIQSSLEVKQEATARAKDFLEEERAKVKEKLEI
jgi:polysaccharide biosynthesis transport protein